MRSVVAGRRRRPRYLAAVILCLASASEAFQPPMARRVLAVRRSASESDVSGDVAAATNSVPVSAAPLDNMPRTIATTEKFARLPVWPAWNGVLLFLLGKIFGEEAAAKLEDQIGGRVCPNFFNPPESTSPFIMLVHHRHSFAPWDPLRYVQRTFFPEGFPAHPHRGFITVTYILRGGFEHRDSMGIQQYYGSEKRHKGKHTQWLTTGAGLLHEEMWDIQADDDGVLPDFLQPSSQELYQLWLNVPSQVKLCSPRVELLGGEEETPTVVHTSMTSDGGKATTTTIVIAGEHGGKRASVETDSDLAILHVMMEKQSIWTHNMRQSHGTGIIYVRRGSITIGGKRVPTHHTAYLREYGTNLTVEAQDSEADFLLLAGEPLNEPVAAQGSMVMNRLDEINEAYADYQMMKMGAPWDHKLTDEEWMQHVQKFPSRYRPEGLQ